MRVRSVTAAVTAAALLVPATVAPGASHHKHRTKRVNVGDDYFGPTRLKVKRGTRIRWVWLAANTDSHDVKLVKAPRHVKKFHSPSAATDFRYTRTLRKRGTYKFVCTLHQNMKLTIRVR